MKVMERHSYVHPNSWLSFLNFYTFWSLNLCFNLVTYEVKFLPYTMRNNKFLYQFFRLLHLSKPGVSTGVVPTAAAAAASLMSDGGGTAL